MMGNETPGMSYVCADEFVLIDDLRNPSPVPFDASSLHSPRAWNAWSCIDWNESLLWLYEIDANAMKLLKSIVLEGIRCYELTEEGLVVLREKEGMARLEVYDLVTTVSTFHLRQEIDVVRVGEGVMNWKLKADFYGHCVLAVVNGYLFVYLQSRGRLEFVGMTAFAQSIVSVGFDTIDRIVVVTSNEIWSSPMMLQLRKPIQDGDELISQCSLLRLQALMDVSEIELSSQSSIFLILLRTVDKLESQLKLVWKKVNPIRLKLEEYWRWCDEEEKVKQKVELRQLLDSNVVESLTEKELTELDDAFQFIEIVEWDKEETERMRRIIRILLWRKQAISTMDLDANAMHYLLTVQLVANHLMSIDFIPSFALLFASFSNSKDTLMNEALTLLTKARLGFSTTPQPSTKSASITTVQSTVAVDDGSGYSACSDRYKFLFTFTSNRSNLTATSTQLPVSETIHEDEDMMQYVTWEEVRRSGLVLWCKSQVMFTKLALRIASVEFILLLYSRISTKLQKILILLLSSMWRSKNCLS